MTRHIAVDIDGVVADWDYGFLNHYNRLHGTQIDPRTEHSEWDFSDILPENKFRQALNTFHEVGLFWQRLPAYVKNCDALRDFLAARPNVNVTYLTARPSPSTGPSALVQTNRWLRAQNLMSDATAVIVVGAWQNKVQVASEICIEAAIDDHTQTVSRMLLAGIAATLLSRPWNQGVDLPRVTDLKSWLDSLK